MLLALLLPSASAGAPAVDVTRLEFAPTAGGTRIVLELSRNVSFRAYTLDRPLRLNVDLPETTWRLAAPPDPEVTPGVRGYEYGLFGQGRSRFVADLAAKHRITSAKLLPSPDRQLPWRLVIDLQAIEPLPAPPMAATPVPSAPTATPEPPATPPAAAVATGTPPQATDEPPAVPPSAGPPVIVIDPGHGGVDPGAVGPNAALEKDIVLAVALQLREGLERSGRYRVKLTRESDIFVRLRERLAKARESEGDLLISLHADSVPHEAARGTSVYTLSTTASDEEAARLASSENRAAILGAEDLSIHDEVVAGILLDLAQRHTNNRSIAFADLLTAELARTMPLVHKTRRAAGFAVLKSPDIPSVLVELGFLSNGQDARDLGRETYRSQLVATISTAIDTYFADDPRLRPAAQRPSPAGPT